MVINISRSVLLEIDVQNDFCPAYESSDGRRFGPGALAVTGGEEVVKPLNALAVKVNAEGGRVIATQDWHPPLHISFASAHEGKKPYDTITIPLKPLRESAARTGLPLPEAIDQALWPDHCVRGSAGAAFHADLDLDPVQYILRKGSDRGLDSYSAFFENDRRTPTGLDGLLKGLGIHTVFLGGLATDYCVLYSALDAARLGYHTVVVRDAVRGVGVPEGSVERAMELMRDGGISFMNSQEII
ncbi:MAG: nicotinamidase [Spirochaetaceae bacterium]|jgi:nicotinamidase/pyrazinamidase|nr:nicotinamidase [Spirochaetaceae bacterium]